MFAFNELALDVLFAASKAVKVAPKEDVAVVLRNIADALTETNHPTPFGGNPLPWITHVFGEIVEANKIASHVANEAASESK